MRGVKRAVALVLALLLCAALTVPALAAGTRADEYEPSVPLAVALTVAAILDLGAIAVILAMRPWRK